MNTVCHTCHEGIPVISRILAQHGTPPVGRHACSRCGALLGDVALQSGMQVIATDVIASEDGRCVIPRGRLLRITSFVELPSAEIGLIFSGMLAAGVFRAAGFAACWDIRRIVVE